MIDEPVPREYGPAAWECIGCHSRSDRKRSACDVPLGKVTEPPRGKAVNQPCIIESDWPETEVIYAVCGPIYSCPTREDAERVKAMLEELAKGLKP